MAVEVHLKLRHALRGPVARASLAGDGLLVRLRSTTIAMLGVVVAVGLALVAIASQMGWPSVLSGPLPQTPEAFARNATIVAPASPSRRRSTTGRRHQRLSRVAAPAVDAPRRTSELTAANPVESPSPEAPPTSQQPSAPKSQGHGSPSSPAPAPSPEAAVTPSPDDEPASGGPVPPTSEAPSPPVAAAPESSPGHSDESHGNHYGQGPPPWAGSSSSSSTSGDGSWDHGHDDDDGGGWSHH